MPHRKVAAALRADFRRIVGVLHVGLAGTAGACGVERRHSILHTAYPAQQVIVVAQRVDAHHVGQQPPIGIIDVIVRPLVGVAHLRQPAQAIILRRGRHTGDALARLRRFICHHHRREFVQCVVLHAFQFVGGERAAVHSALVADVDRATQGVGVAVRHVVVGINTRDFLIGVVIA